MQTKRDSCVPRPQRNAHPLIRAGDAGAVAGFGDIAAVQFVGEGAFAHVQMTFLVFSICC